MSHSPGIERKPFIRRHGVTLFTLALFIGAFFLVRWVVRTQRSPGAVTVIEAQGMDMSAMKAPPGTQPVAAEKAAYRFISDAQTFPATAVAYSDEEVVARVPGRVLWTSYPGDLVKSGQIVVRVQADEYAAQGAQASAVASGSGAMASAAEDEVARMQSAHSRYIADVSAMASSVAKQQADHDVAIAEQAQTAQTAAAKQSAVIDAQAQLDYQDQDLHREEELYTAGAISLDHYQKSQAAEKSASARVASAKAEASSAVSATTAAVERVKAAERGVTEAQAQWHSAQSRADESSKAVAKASDEARARQAEGKAARSSAAGARVMADYRQLRAMNDAMVAERLVSPGSIVTSGQKLLMLHVADPIRIQANVPQDLAANVHVGSAVTVSFGSAARPAKVTSIFPQADPTTRTFTVEALLRNPDHSILPGSFASMQIETGTSERGLAVRRAAVLTDATGGKFVWIVITKKGSGTVTDWTCPMHTQVSLHEPGKCPICSMPLVPRSRGGTMMASRRSVTTGDSDDTYTMFKQGIEEGDLVIWAGLENLVEGASVEVTPWGPNGPMRMLQPDASGSSKPMPGMEMPAGIPSTGQQRVSPRTPAAKQLSGTGPKVKKQLWTCPMHPQVIQDHPGKCPICGMELVPKKDTK